MPQKPINSATHSTQRVDNVELVDKRLPKRDAARSKKSILGAALIEFSRHGHAGARIDRIARNAGISKPMIYGYFGDTALFKPVPTGTNVMDLAIAIKHRV